MSPRTQVVLALTALLALSAATALIAHRYVRSIYRANILVAVVAIIGLVFADAVYAGYLSGWSFIGALVAGVLAYAIAALIGKAMDRRAISARQRMGGSGA
jgi:hypothetical protein